MPARLATPNGDYLELIDYCWPKPTMLEMLSSAGFREIEVFEPTLPASYDGPHAALMQLERDHPPYVIYLAYA